MTNDEYIRLGNKTLKEFPNYTKQTYDDLAKMISCRNSELTNYFKQELAKKYAELFLNSEYFNKILEYEKNKKTNIHYYINYLYNDIPFIKYKLGEYLFNLHIGEGKQDSILALFEEVKNNLINIDETAYNNLIKSYTLSQELSAQFKIYEEKDKRNISIEEKIEIEKYYYNLTKNFKNTYEYVDLYKESQKNKELEELYIFSLDRKYNGKTLNKITSDYLKVKIGNIGEYYTYLILKNINPTIHSSKAIGNGLGYDLYQLIQSFDTLYEVKTTILKEGKQDYFTLSENEYYIMKKTLKEQNANYIIVRVYLNEDLSFKNIEYININDYLTLSNCNTTFKQGITDDNSRVYRKI